MHHISDTSHYPPVHITVSNRYYYLPYNPSQGPRWYLNPLYSLFAQQWKRSFASIKCDCVSPFFICGSPIKSKILDMTLYEWPHTNLFEELYYFLPFLCILGSSHHLLFLQI